MGRSTGIGTANTNDDDLPWYTIGSSEEQKMQYRKTQANLEAAENVRRAKQGLRPRTEAQDAYSRALNRAGSNPIAPTVKNPSDRQNVAPGGGSQRNVIEYPSMAGRAPSKMAPRRSVTPRVGPGRAKGMVTPTQPELNALSARPRDVVQYDSGTLNPSEFGPATMGPAARPGPVMGSMENVDVDRIGRGGFEATPAQMRRGLFGEEISQEDYDAMTRRNKEATPFYGQFLKKGGQVKKKPVKKMAKGGTVSSASKRGDGCAQRGKTKGRMV